jgi:hypothetical protein
MKKLLLVVTVLLCLSSYAWADFQSNPPGLSEYIACPSSGSFTPIQWWGGWNDYSTQFFDSHSLGQDDTYWNYASPDNDGGGNCDPWVRGEVAGGAGFVSGTPSSASGRNVNVTTYWYDFYWPTFSDQSMCGHQHLVTYVWGWRYFGNSWSLEFVSSTMTSTHWNASTQWCEFQGDGNPDYTSVPSEAYGNGVVRINNSPYAVLYTASQAVSHGGGPCGEFACYHPLLASSWFD